MDAVSRANISNDVSNSTQDELEQRIQELEATLEQTSKELLQRNWELENQLEAASNSHSQLEQLYSIINSTLQTSRDGIILMDDEGDPILFNSTAATLLNTTQSYIGQADYNALESLMLEKTKNSYLFSEQLNLIRKDPHTDTLCTLELNDGRIVECSSYVREQSGEVIGRVWNFHDITELRRNEEEIRYRAFHDPLTGLPNRTLFTDRITHALSRQQRKPDEVLALLFVDLDGFKYVNDTLGHETGDQLLREVAQRLAHVVREQDTIARHGGDEFLILLEAVQDSQEICQISERILKQLTKVFNGADQEIYISASIGITIAPKDGDTPETLIRNADMAMYQAKSQGRNNFQYFQPEMTEQAKQQLQVQSQLNTALQNQEFCLHFQPKIDLRSGKIIGAEALIRWRQGDKLIMPGDFISIAEQSGLIIPMSEWVIDQVCQHAQKWGEQLSSSFSLSLNLSASHFKQGNITEFVAQSIEKYGIKPSCLELELTESVVLENPNNSIEQLFALRQLGVKLSIDDFGTGYSSFNYLKNLPIHILKIDKSFIEDIDVLTRDLALVNSIVEIAHILGLEVVAEGVETVQMVQLLKETGCDMAQGYHYSKPLPAMDFLEFVGNYSA